MYMKYHLSSYQPFVIDSKFICIELSYKNKYNILEFETIISHVMHVMALDIYKEFLWATLHDIFIITRPIELKFGMDFLTPN